jgi:hypothetical protein
VRDSREACNEQRRAIVGGCLAVVMIFIVMVIAAMT